MTAIVELIVFTGCPQCGEKEGWLSRGLPPITSVSALRSNNKQRLSGQCVPSRKCTNCWERKREAQCTWLWNTAETHSCICTVLYFRTKIKPFVCERFKGKKNVFRAETTSWSWWTKMATISPLCPCNRSLYSYCGIYMFHGGINYKLREQWSRVEPHSCPTESFSKPLNTITQPYIHFYSSHIQRRGQGGIVLMDQNHVSWWKVICLQSDHKETPTATKR